MFAPPPNAEQDVLCDVAEVEADSASVAATVLPKSFRIFRQVSVVLYSNPHARITSSPSGSKAFGTQR